VEEDAKQSIIDAEHLKLLRWGYFLSAGVTACFSVFGLFYAGMALLITSMPVKEGQDAPPEQIAWLFAIVGIAITVVMLAVAAAKLKVAKALRERTSRTFCYVVAVITMFGMPYGTLLGVFTLLVLSRPSVAQAFGADASATVPQPGEPASGA
jgi:divalent metal cation (Fe/Co/Zn/Cd) transporter